MSSELFSLAGRVALVTGGNSGIGRAIALAFRQAGAPGATLSVDERLVIAAARAVAKLLIRPLASRLSSVPIDQTAYESVP